MVLVFGRNLKSTFDSLIPNKHSEHNISKQHGLANHNIKKTQDVQSKRYGGVKIRDFHICQKCLVNDFRQNNNFFMGYGCHNEETGKNSYRLSVSQGRT